jgi:predicted alpha/beta-hydrolase family hydrolase
MTPAPPPAHLAGLTLVLGHGASGTSASMQPHVQGLARRGIDALAIDLPKRRAEEAVGAYAARLPDAPRLAIGGHSYGGRVASLLAADRTATAGRSIVALVLLSYPLHRPGGPELGPRVAHWPAIECPVLLLSGESDLFARIDLLREAVKTLPDAELVTYPKVGHGLASVLDDALDRVARFLRDRATAGEPAARLG